MKLDPDWFVPHTISTRVLPAGAFLLAAGQALLRVSSLVESESRLPFEDRTRVQAVRALMLRDLDTAVQAYAEATSTAEEQQALVDYELNMAETLPTVSIAYMSVVWVVSDKVSGLEPRASQFMALNTVSLG